MKIELTKGYYTIVDDCDFNVLNQHSWMVRISGGKAYAQRSQRIGKDKITIVLHRFIMDAQPGQYVDHINGDSLDNRCSNLRLCTQKQNCQNMKGQPKLRKVSKYKGVRKRGSKWYARIQVNSKELNIGKYSTEEAAALAYNEAAIRYYGEFACLNDLLKT